MSTQLRRRAARFWVTPDPDGLVVMAMTDPELEHTSTVMYLRPQAALALADELRRAAQEATELDGGLRWTE